MTDAPGGGDEPVQVALGFESDRNRELLAAVLDGYDVVVAVETVPEGTDLCVVDAAGFERLRDPLTAWKEAERPVVAPVLLVAGGDTADLWEQYADSIGAILDAVQSVPAPKRAIRAQVDGLAALRRYSAQAADQRDQLELYGRALDDAQVGITIADATEEDLPLVYVNDRFCELTGYDRDEALGRNCRFLQGPETAAEKRAAFREAFAAEKPVTVELRNYRADGEMFWNEVQVVPVHDPEGDVTHYIGFQQDVTERKRRQSQLEEYEQVVESVNDPILVLDTDGMVQYTNEAAEAAFGTVPRDATLAALFADEQAAIVRDALDTVRTTGQTLTRELSIVGPVGSAATYQLRFQPLAVDDAERIIVVARDVTDIRKHQNRLSVLDRVLRHNLRNKLNVVTGRAQGLVDNPDQPPAAVTETAASITAAAEDLLDLVDSVREFDIETGDVTTTELDVTRVVRETVPVLRDRYPSLQLSTDLPAEARARCPARLQTCIEQLVANAIERGDAAATLQLAVTANDDAVTLRVHDDGQLPTVERRALAAGGETQLEHTQGIDIWLVRWTVEESGGRFLIAEDDADGTAVELTFPR